MTHAMLRSRQESALSYYLRTYLCNDFHLLALAVLGLRHSRLDSLDKLVVQFLSRKRKVSRMKTRFRFSRFGGITPSYRSARDGQFDLPPMCAHKFLEVV